MGTAAPACRTRRDANGFIHNTPTRKWLHTLPVQYETMKALNESVRGIVASWERKRETYDTCIVVYEARCARFRPCTHPAPPVSFYRYASRNRPRCSQGT